MMTMMMMVFSFLCRVWEGGKSELSWGLEDFEGIENGGYWELEGLGVYVKNCLDRQSGILKGDM